MYIINETYFQAPKREIPNLNESDSKSFAELAMLIDEKCRLFMYYFLTPDEVVDFNSYLVDGIFPTVTTGIPQKWIDLVNGTTYTSNDVDLVWGGLIQEIGTAKNSLLADFVYYHWLVDNVSYMTGVGDSKGNPKGANLVNPTQRVVNVWNEFVYEYQRDVLSSCNDPEYGFYRYYDCDIRLNPKVSLIQFLSDNKTDYTSENRQFFEVKNQLGI